VAWRSGPTTLPSAPIVHGGQLHKQKRNAWTGSERQPAPPSSCRRSFQYTGYFVYRLYKGSLIQNGAGRFPTYQEFLRDVRQVASGIIQNNQLSAAAIEQNKKTFAEEFTRRAEFRSLYDPLSNFDYVERLFQTTGINVSATDKQALVEGLNNQTETRASVLQKVVDGG
jgi:hypothetical protein